jgi:putative flippase GtrA
MQATVKTSINATLHCLTGCAVGEVTGLILGTALGWSNVVTLAISIVLAFVVGYILSIRPLLSAGLALSAAMPIVLAADSLSIVTMETVDTTIEAVVPGAMSAGLLDLLFWSTLVLSLVVAFVAAVPVNYWLIRRGKGHALSHQYHEANHKHTEPDHALELHTPQR